MEPFIAFITIMPVSWVHATSIHIRTQTGMISLTSWSTPLGRTLLMLILLLRNVVRITMMMVMRWVALTPLHPCLSTCEATKDLQHLPPWWCVPCKSGMLLKITSKHGEKATLAIEVRGLQSRPLILSDERMVYVTRSKQVQLPIDITRRRMEPWLCYSCWEY